MITRRPNFQSDFMFSVVRVPNNWRPESIFDVTSPSRVVSRMPVASFEEAHDDLIRCNRIAISLGLRDWAMIETAGEST